VLLLLPLLQYTEFATSQAERESLQASSQANMQQQLEAARAAAQV
jgi:hypothetical protein